MGLLGLSPSAFWSMTFGEIGAASEAKSEHDEIQQRAEWERARWLGVIIMQPHLKKGRNLKPKDLAVFPWERTPLKGSKMTSEELFEVIEQRDGWQN
tara:strand:- start:2112 stop:2402 length:291 start_codon:yes stop_codon:yes gene_type:complete